MVEYLWVIGVVIIIVIVVALFYYIRFREVIAENIVRNINLSRASSAEYDLPNGNIVTVTPTHVTFYDKTNHGTYEMPLVDGITDFGNGRILIIDGFMIEYRHGNGDVIAIHADGLLTYRPVTGDDLPHIMPRVLLLKPLLDLSGARRVEYTLPDKRSLVLTAINITFVDGLLGATYSMSTTRETTQFGDGRTLVIDVDVIAGKKVPGGGNIVTYTNTDGATLTIDRDGILNYRSSTGEETRRIAPQSISM